MLRLLVTALVLGTAAFAGDIGCPHDTHEAIVKLRALLRSRTPYRWTSTISVGGAPLLGGPLTRERAFGILRDAVAPGSTVVRDFVRETGLGSDLREPAFWNLYARSYDLLTCSRGYTQVMFNASDALSLARTHSNRIFDGGAGTGNIAALALYNHPNLTATLLDSSDQSLRIAQEKLQHLEIDPARYRVLSGSLLDPLAYPMAGTLRAVILNNVLYTLNSLEKRSVLRLAARSLEPGGLLIIGDPLPAAMTGARLVEFYRQNLESAIDVGAPLEDFNLTAMLAVNLVIQASRQPRYFTEPAELIRLVGDFHLTLERQETAYFDGASFLVFRRAAGF